MDKLFYYLILCIYTFNYDIDYLHLLFFYMDIFIYGYFLDTIFIYYYMLQ